MATYSAVINIRPPGENFPQHIWLGNKLRKYSGGSCFFDRKKNFDYWCRALSLFICDMWDVFRYALVSFAERLAWR